MLRELLPDGLKLSTPKGTCVIKRPAPHVELMIGSGHAVIEYVPEILASRDAILAAHGKIALFDDLENVTGYDSDVRLALTEWSKPRRDRIVAFHILLRSKLLAMGVSVASLALGGKIRVHSSRESFERALAEQLR